jgi:hypothetical protein
MKIEIKNILFIIALFLTFEISAQTVNSGDFYISPNTTVSTVGEMDNLAMGNLLNDGDFYLYDHYNNEGLVSFTPASTTGTTHLSGLFGFQNISGNSPMEWNNVEFDNTVIKPAFHLSNTVSIAGVSDFNKGIVDNHNFGGSIIFEKASSHFNTSNDSHVDGSVIKNGDDAFTFPVGDNNYYRFAAISAPDNVLSTFQAKYINESSDVLYPHNQKEAAIEIIDDNEYWTIDKTEGTADVFITLSWDEFSTTPEDVVQLPTGIHIARWDTAKKIWVDEGGVVSNVADRTVTSLVKVSGYGVFTIAKVKEKISPCKALKIYNAISPDGDSENAEFKIEGLTECSSDNTVEIYNRWGVKVYETSNYGSSGNVFKGLSEGRSVVLKNELLPSGTYFYILNINYKENNTNQTYKKAGYLYLGKQ